MRKIALVLILALSLLSGCVSPDEQRQNIIARFQQAYPVTWQQRLLEYDLQQQQKIRDAWSGMWEQVNENTQRQLDRQAYQLDQYNRRVRHQTYQGWKR